MTELRYGYTMRDLQRIAGHAASTAWTRAAAKVAVRVGPAS